MSVFSVGLEPAAAYVATIKLPNDLMRALRSTAKGIEASQLHVDEQRCVLSIGGREFPLALAAEGGAFDILAARGSSMRIAGLALGRGDCVVHGPCTCTRCTCTW